MAIQDKHDHTANGHDESQPALTVNAQYLKDATFENPNPINSFQHSDSSPEINVSIDIKLDKINDKTYEVCLHIATVAERGQDKLFVAEIDYAGIFTLGNVPDDAVQPILMIECPRMLFPYARQVIANLTREGGYPALSLNPIDFVEMYRQQLEHHQQHANPTQPN